MRKLLQILLIALLVTSLTLPALADETYPSYTYNEWDDSVATPAGYTVARTIYSNLAQGGPWKTASDLCVTPGGTILLADTGNNRILEYDADWNLIRTITEVGAGESVIALIGPTGLHVSQEGKLYIAMPTAPMAVICDLNTLTVDMVIDAPKHALLGEDFTFTPAKIGADKAGRIYILSTGCYSGFLQFSPEGEFMGYYGSNKVAVTAEVIFNYYWKMIMTDEQRASMTSVLPVEYSNLYCAPDGFVYASTVSTTYAVNQVKRLNPLGNNTFLKNEQEINFGDEELAYLSQGTASGNLMPTFVDVVTTPDCEFIFAVDRAYGRVFERDRNGNLIAVFGSTGHQTGTFQQPVAIELLGNQVLVLDAMKNSVTIFEPTEYVKLVHDAVSLYNAGEYTASRDLWLDVLKRNTNATQAYAGVGRSLLKENDYEGALQYFRLGDSREEYSQAYRIVRLNAIRDNAPMAVAVVVAVLVLWKLLSFLWKRFVKKNPFDGLGGKLLDTLHLSRYTVFPRTLTHPFAGYSDIRFTKRVALWPSVLIIIAFVMASIYEFVGKGYLFNQNNIADINIWLLLGKSLGVLVVFIVAQWSMSILCNGSGRLRDIVITAAYALAPYTIGLFVGTWMSNFLVMNELYAEYIILIGTGWGLILLVVGTMQIHELSFTRALGFLVLTVLAMAVILFVGVLFYTLLTQLATFFFSLYVEIVFRL